MDSQAMLMSALEVVIPILVTFALTQIVRYFQHAIGKESFDKAVSIVAAVVDAVEQETVGQYTSAEKKALAIRYAKKLGLKLSDEQIGVIIESIVKGMNDTKKYLGGA